MHCPVCNSPDSKVRDSRPGKRSVQRRRECIACGHRWDTTEVHQSSARKGRQNLDQSVKDKIARMAKAGATQTAVAKAMRLSQSTVSRHWPLPSASRQGAPAFSADTEDEIVRRYRDDRMSCERLAVEFGVGEKTIRRIVQAAGAMRAPGQTSPGSTEEKRREASRLFHVEGVKNRAAIARKLGLGYMAVHRAVDLRLHIREGSVG